MTMRYAHLGPEHKKRAVARLDAEVTANLTTVTFADSGVSLEVPQFQQVAR